MNGKFRRAVKPEGKTNRPDAPVDIELHTADAEVTLHVLLPLWRKNQWAIEGKSDLSSVGVTGEHEVNQLTTGV